MVAIVASSLIVDKHGEWLRKEWGNICNTRKGWVKFHVPVNVDTHEILAVEIAKENVGDQKEFVPLVQEYLDTGVKVEQVRDHQIFNNNDIHNFLAHKHIQPSILPYKNINRRSRESPSRRGGTVLPDSGETVWKVTCKYAKRITVERTFFAFQRLFGYPMMAKK